MPSGTTVPLTTKSTLAAPTRTSNALVEGAAPAAIPATASWLPRGVMSVTSSPTRRLIKYVPFCATRKYRYLWLVP